MTPEGSKIVRRNTDFDAVTIGETMISFVSHHDPQRFIAVTAGAESNVAVGMARLGCRTQWVSRLGNDPLGSLVEESLGGAGVAVSVVRDEARPTGIMTKHVTAAGTRVGYYRSGSAARSLSVDDLDRVDSTRWIHVTGITPALSASAARLAEAIVGRDVAGNPRVSFDVNLRPTLWPDPARAAHTLLDLARGADLVFIGGDEAETLFGTSDTEALAGMVLRRRDQELVLRRGPEAASLVTVDGEISEPALGVDVVDATGAGDAFVAGYLAAAVFEWPPEARLRLGHLMGSRVVGTLEDTAPPLSHAERAALSPAWLASRWSTERTGGSS